MAVTIGTLLINVEAGTASFTSEMGKMSALSARTASSVKRSLETIAAAGIAMGAAVATGVAALIEGALESVDSLSKLAESAGTTTESLSTLAYAASLSGISTEKMGVGLERLSKSAFAAQNGNKLLTNVFQRLGVTVTDSDGHLKDSGEIMGNVATKFSGMADGAGKTALAIALFGKSGAALIPFLNQYGAEQAKINEEARQFGLVIGVDLSKASVEAHDQLVKLEAMVKGVGIAILSATLPQMIKLSEQLIQLAKDANLPDLAKQFGSEAADAIRLVGEALGFAARNAHDLKIALEALIGLRIAGIIVPLLAQAGTAGWSVAAAGAGKFAASLLGINKALPALARVGSFAKELPALAAEFGIAETAGYGLSAALAAIGGPITLIVAGLAALGGILYYFRDTEVSVAGATFEFRDAYLALLAVMTNSQGPLGIAIAQQIALREAMKSPTGIAQGLFNSAAAAAAAKASAPAKYTPDTSGLGAKKDPYQDEINKLAQATAAQRAYLAVLDSSPDKILAVTSAEKARGIIVDLNNRLVDAGKAKLTGQQEAMISWEVAQQALTASVVTYGRELVNEQHAAAKATEEENLKNAAIFQGEAAARQAAIEATLLGLSYGKTGAELQRFNAELPKLRANLEARADISALGEFATSIERAQRAAMLAGHDARALAAAELEGVEAVRQASIENQIYGLTFGKTAEEIAAMSTQLSILRALESGKGAAETTGGANEEIRSLREELAARQILIPAMIQFTEVQREADLQAKLLALDTRIANEGNEQAKAALMGQRDAVVALTQAEWAEADAQKARELLSPVTLYAEEIDNLQREAAALAAAQGGTLDYGEQMVIAGKEQEAFNKAIDDTVKGLLLSNNAMDGVRAFFLEMQKSAQTAALIIKDTLTKTFDDLSEQLAKLVTGGKTSFAKMFEDLGRNALASTFKSGLQQGLGAIGKATGLGGLLGGAEKPDGSRSRPFYVTFAGGLQPAAAGGYGEVRSGTSIPGLGDLGGDADSGGETSGTAAASGVASLLSHLLGGGVGKALGGLFGGGSQGGGIFSMLGIPGFAEGSDSTPQSAYLVGEQGPEIMARANMRVVNNADTNRILSQPGGGDHYYNIDARGTDPALTEQRVRSAIVAAHQSAVVNATLVQAERVKRTPQQ